MKKELKGFYDGIDFVSNPDSTKYETCLGDDTDALIGCSYLKEVAGIEVNGFYDFDNIYLSDNKDAAKSFIGVDMSLMDGHKCWDNHIQLISPEEDVNKNCANINAFYKINASSQAEYHKKYAGSTALQMFAYYDGKKPKTIEGALLWISIDSGFKGHYNPKFKEIHNGYLEDLGLSWMIDVLNKYNYAQLNRFMHENGMNSKIKLAPNGRLFNVGKWMREDSGLWSQGNALNMAYMQEHLGFSIALPTNIFYHNIELYRHSKRLSEIEYDKLDRENIVSMAFTYANQLEFTASSQQLFLK